MQLRDFEGKYRNFYAPAFRIKVDNQDVLKKGIEIASVSVDNTLEGANQFSFTVNNVYDQRKRELKWVDDVFAFGSKVEIRMGYVDKLELMIIGLITSVRVSFPSGSMPQLEISGFDLSHRMMKGKKSRSWDEIKDSEVASQVSSTDYSLGTSKIVDTKLQNPRVNQNEESDYEFLKRLAEQNGFEFFVFGEDVFFRPPANDLAEILTLTWGANLVSFTPELNIAEQISEVEVRGWSIADKKDIIGKAKSGDEFGRDSGRKSGSEIVAGLNKEQIVERVRRPVYSQQEADELARSILNKHAEGLVQGSGESIGIPEILPGTNLKLEGMGKKFSKTYYIQKTNHSITSSGYRTTFNVKESTI